MKFISAALIKILLRGRGTVMEIGISGLFPVDTMVFNLFYLGMRKNVEYSLIGRIIGFDVLRIHYRDSVVEVSRESLPEKWIHEKKKTN